MAFPWSVILKQAPMLLSAAETLLASSRRRADASATHEAQAVRQRLEHVETHQQLNAELVRQLTEQVGALAQAAEATASRLRLTLILAGAGVGLGLAACAIALIR